MPETTIRELEARAAPAFDLARVREDFPILSRQVHGHPLSYLDNAASTQKPRAVPDALARCYGESYANVSRGVHTLSQEATAAYEGARERVARFLGAAGGEIVFVRGTTEAINLVAQSFGPLRVRAGDRVLVTALEHHSNLVPWQLLCERQGATLDVAPIDDRGAVIVEEFARLLTPKTRIAAFTHISNSLGTVNPVRELAALARANGTASVIDGAQGAPHLKLDMADLGCDFYAFSGHKVYGPSGIGVLFGRAELLAEMPPWQGGGGMIESVSYERSTYAPPPTRFEAGTPAIEAAIGLAAALDYLDALGLEAVGSWERQLLAAATARLAEIPGVRIVGTAPEKAAVLSFVVDGVHPHDVGTILDRYGVAVRAGHHCCQPLMKRLGVNATARASFAFYNALEDVEALAAGLLKVREVFA